MNWIKAKMLGIIFVMQGKTVYQLHKMFVGSKIFNIKFMKEIENDCNYTKYLRLFHSLVILFVSMVVIRETGKPIISGLDWSPLLQRLPNYWFWLAWNFYLKLLDSWFLLCKIFQVIIPQSEQFPKSKGKLF